MGYLWLDIQDHLTTVYSFRSNRIQSVQNIPRTISSAFPLQFDLPSDCFYTRLSLEVNTFTLTYERFTNNYFTPRLDRSIK